MPRCVFPDGLFHVATRGVAKMAIYHDDNDRRNFLSLLALAVHQFEWTCHAFCLMTNHYHLVLDTTRESLSDGMQLLNGDYAQGFNGKYGRWDTYSVTDCGADRLTRKSSSMSVST
jgi:REP element-mobilizing transposase RayT